MAKDLFKTRPGFNCVPQAEEREALRLYLKFADKLLSHFDEWKDIDRFYYVPVSLNMAYFSPVGPTAIAFPPYFIGIVLRNSMAHPELFSTKCSCGHRAYAYSYNGSPLSGRVDMSLACPVCGARLKITESGWKVRGDALRKSQKGERMRITKIRLFHPRFEPAKIQELLRFIGLKDEDLVLPPEEHKITYTRLADGRVLANDSAGGFVIMDKDSR